MNSYSDCDCYCKEGTYLQHDLHALAITFQFLVKGHSFHVSSYNGFALVEPQLSAPCSVIYTNLKFCCFLHKVLQQTGASDFD